MTALDGVTRATRVRVARRLLRAIADGLPFREAAVTTALELASPLPVAERGPLIAYVAEITDGDYVVRYLAWKLPDPT